MAPKIRRTDQELSKLVQDYREYIFDEGIEEVLCEVLIKCFEAKPINPIKYIADQIYITEGLTIPDESEDSKDERIYQLEKDLEYYKSLMNSLKIGSDLDTQNRIQSAESSLKTTSQDNSCKLPCPSSILLDNGVKIQMPQMTPGGGYSFPSIELMETENGDFSEIPNADLVIDNFFQGLDTENRVLADAQPNQNSVKKIISEIMNGVEKDKVSAPKLIAAVKDIKMTDCADTDHGLDLSGSESDDETQQSQEANEESGIAMRTSTANGEHDLESEHQPKVLIHSNELLLSPIKDLNLDAVDMELDEDLNNNHQQNIEIKTAVAIEPNSDEKETERAKSREKSLSDQCSELSSQSPNKTDIHESSSNSNIVSEFASDLAFTQKSKSYENEEKDKDSSTEEDSKSDSEKEGSETVKENSEKENLKIEKEDSEKEKQILEPQKDPPAQEKPKAAEKFEIPPLGLDFDDDFNPDYEDDDL